MFVMRGFHDLLFEMSNENRYKILLLLREESKRITDLTRNTELTTTEVRRHVSRLSELGLLRRDVEGLYHLTPYGETSLLLSQELQYLSSNSDYFEDHTPSLIPTRFLKRIGELSGSSNLTNAMNFFHQTDNLVREEKKFVWMIVDQFPIYSLPTIVESIERGVEFKIIEQRERVLNPDLDAVTSNEIQALSKARSTPLVGQRMVDEVSVYMFVSDSRWILAFPTTDGQFDYKGFTASDDSSREWCRELFNYYWGEAEPRVNTPATQVQRGRILKEGESRGSIVVEGHWRPDIDAQAIQDAVDNYEEVILKGAFNIGTSTIFINRSIVIRGEGRENDIPITKIRKSGWKFPFTHEESLFIVRGKDIDVTIENLHFGSFNYTCIWNREGNSSKIFNNRITLSSPLGHGASLKNWGDVVIGILSGGPSREKGGFPGGLHIEGNYIDFAEIPAWAGYIERKGLETNPDYRPDLLNHESSIDIGILVNRSLGNVLIRNNVIRNMSSKGIHVQDNWGTADIKITDNVITSEVFGSYAYSNPNAGFGIMAQSSLNAPFAGGRLEMTNNEIRCEKVNYCGIGVNGPSLYLEGSGKFEECIISGNKIHLGNGTSGIHIRKSDRTKVVDNILSGRAYYGIQLSGISNRDEFDLGACDNVVEGNDLDDLDIKKPDVYSDSNVDGHMFTGLKGKSATAQIWLNEFSARNTINVKADETVIDEGKDNTISYQEDKK
jgi:predicted transcriptional regulator